MHHPHHPSHARFRCAASPFGLSALAFFLCFLACSGIGKAQYSEITLHNFGDIANDGNDSTTGVIQASDGNFYGTTLFGGVDNEGAVYEMTPGGTVTILHSFGTDGPHDGTAPQAPLIQASDGNLYGTTVTGGTFGEGTLFKFQPGGASFSIVANFNSTGGDIPNGALLQGSSTNLYGILHNDGSHGNGAIFSFDVTVTPPAAPSYLFEFGSLPDVGTPETGLVEDASGNFYGISQAGGTAGAGTVFRLSPSGTLTILHSFRDGTPNDGVVPDSPSDGLILGSDGNLYGMSGSSGVTNDGTVFKITSPGSSSFTYSIIHLFAGQPNDGSGPFAGLIQLPDGNFYGTTYAGGSANMGTVFQMTPSGTVTILHNFGDGTVANDGTEPQASLFLGADGALYGTTTGGGTHNAGTIFKLLQPRTTDTPALPTWALVTLALLLPFVAARRLITRPACS